jgi:hypothetical protein
MLLEGFWLEAVERGSGVLHICSQALLPLLHTLSQLDRSKQAQIY